VRKITRESSSVAEFERRRRAEKIIATHNRPGIEPLWFRGKKRKVKKMCPFCGGTGSVSVVEDEEE